MSPTRGAEPETPRLLRHASALVLTRAALAGAGLAVVDELPLRVVRGHRVREGREEPDTPPMTRLSIARPSRPGLGFLVVETGSGGGTSSVEVSSLDSVSMWLPVDHLGYVLREWSSEHSHHDAEFDHASSAEVARVVELRELLPLALLDAVEEHRSPSVAGRWVLEAVTSPEVGLRRTVLGAARLLTSLAAGVPLEWCLRHAVAVESRDALPEE